MNTVIFRKAKKMTVYRKRIHSPANRLKLLCPNEFSDFYGAPKIGISIIDVSPRCYGRILTARCFLTRSGVRSLWALVEEFSFSPKNGSLESFMYDVSEFTQYFDPLIVGTAVKYVRVQKHADLRCRRSALDKRKKAFFVTRN